MKALKADVFLLVCFLAIKVAFPRDLNPVLVYDVTVMQNGFPQSGLNYRIPVVAIGPLNGTLVVVLEQRLGGTSDGVPKNIAYKYSEDNGITWSPISTIFESPDSGKIFMGNLIVDAEKGSILVIFTACSKDCPGNKWSNYVSKSLDDGRTWSKPVNISSQIGAFEYCGGPSLGVQKRYPPNKGRLIACGHTEPILVDGVYCVFSDDHGDNWTLGKPHLGIPFEQDKVEGDYLPDEVTMVELPNGDLMVNARNQGSFLNHFHCPCRMTMISKDGGETFPTEFVRINEDLPDPACAAGLALFDNKTLLFTNPNNANNRVDMTLSVVH
ncbi:sialidase-1-like [Symsagittifera roscoffensis]|uniref:sialidase-1-like n=1 Tax=Symsagittifera roscoffensis TaxID=84072 RepID=UPI00307C2B11